MAVTKDQVVDFLKSMSVIELADFVKELEEIFGVSAAAPVAQGVPVSTGDGAAPVGEKTDFEVILLTSGDQKVQVIKVVREITQLGLKEAKALVDEAPKPIKSGIPKEEAEAIAAQVAAVGGTTEIK